MSHVMLMLALIMRSASGRNDVEWKQRPAPNLQVRSCDAMSMIMRSMDRDRLLLLPALACIFSSRCNVLLHKIVALRAPPNITVVPGLSERATATVGALIIIAGANRRPT